jgi:tRNA-splicing ligase RtcB (3'-phosphate/5'-hydroxy nucleic acid ligase)
MHNIAKTRIWAYEPLGSDVARTLERLADIDDIGYIAVMPDVHLAHDICIGTVVAARECLYPQAVGNDIGCGMSSICLGGIDRERFEKKVSAIYRLLGELVPVIKHRTEFAELPPELAMLRLSDEKLEKLKHRDGKLEFATIGRGNHFLELQRDESERLWLAVHTGSRGIGQAIAKFHLNRIEGNSARLRAIAAESEAGRAYLNDVRWAQLYAKLSRRTIIDVMTEALSQILDVKVAEHSRIECDHNHVQSEEHFGRQYWVHRKGAIHAARGTMAIIPGSMGSATYQIEGRGNSEALCSASHGAGRTMSRNEARRRITLKKFRESMAGIYYDVSKEYLLRDEAVSAYKSISRVMQAQQELVKIVRVLRPALSYKGV